MNVLSLETAILSEDRNKLIILDQTLLPNEVKYLELATPESIWEAIYKLRVRGAPAIGVAAAYGIYVITKQLMTESMEEFASYFRKEKEYLDSSRPTAVNLSWALNRMERVLDENISELSVAQMKDRLGEEADAIRAEDIAISRNIGKYGFGYGPSDLRFCSSAELVYQQKAGVIAESDHVFHVEQVAGVRTEVVFYALFVANVDEEAVENAGT